MLKLGNIIPYCPYDERDLFNVYELMEEVNTELPTLIIGWETVKGFYDVDKLDPLDRKIDDNIFWTFDKKEYREYFSNDIYDFKVHAKNKLFDGLYYVNADPIQHGEAYNKIISKIHSFDNIVSFMTDNVVYLYSDKFVIGFDLELYDWLNERENILSKIESLSDVFLTDKEALLTRYSKYMVDMDKEMKYVPYLFNKEQQN